MVVQRSARFLAAALLVSLPAFAQTGECPPTGSNDGGVAGEAEGCPDPHGPLTTETRGLDSNWNDIQLDQRLDRLGAHPSDASEPPEVRESELRLPPRPIPPESERTWTVDLDAVVGQSHAVPVTSGLMTVRFRPLQQLGLGVVVPFSFGVQPEVKCLGDMCGVSSQQAFVDLGNLELFGTWEPIRGPRTQLALGLAVAFPGGFGFSRGAYLRSPAVALSGPTRGFEDLELLLRWVGGVVPSLGVSHSIGTVDLAATARAGFLLFSEGYESALFLFGGLGTVQVMFRVVDQPHARVSVGVRALGALWTVNDLEGGYTRAYGYDAEVMSPASVAVEPRVELRYGGLELRTGFIIPVAYRETNRTEFRNFPDAWGVRVGVGYSF